MTGTSWWGRSGRGPQSESCRLLSVDAESRVFSRLRATIAWETLRFMLSGARLRLALVVLLSAVFWGSLYALFIEGFSLCALTACSQANRHDA